MPDELVTAERDLYKRLIELAAHDDLDALLDEALAMVLELVGAKKGVIAVREGGGEAIAFVACDAREELSSGIVAEAISSQKTVSTASARSDPRFSGNKSVQAARIEAVVCAPVGKGGALYVAGRREPGPFGEREVRIVETCAKGLAPFSSRLAARARATKSTDATAEIRARMRAPAVIGRSPALARVLAMAHVAASSDVAVLLLGETGSGKSALARAIHDASTRAQRPFVELNCAAIPEALVESELFGAEKGAHSTATRRITGKLAAADGGTLLLDEIGELPQESQAKLLAFLQSKKFFMLGASTPTSVDVRVIAATNTQVEETLREDLYYRLAVLTIHVPPLRERREDIAVLADAFAARAGLPLTFAAKAALASAELPGNVRELEAAIARGAAFARAEGSDAIDARHVFPATPTDVERSSYQAQMRQHQARVLKTALDQNETVSDAAKALDLSRSRFYELLRAHGLDKK
jgi:Nif-specific regulatory protein